MSQWGQGQQQPGFQYPTQTGFPGGNPQFQQNQFQQNPQFQQQQQTPQQNPQFQQGFGQGLAPQQTGFPGQRPQGFQQPQQTGFPGQAGFLQSQPANFTGGVGNFQQRSPAPPIPPVPSLPSQFQSQNTQNSFLGAPRQPQQQSGGFGGVGLASQPTGFPGGISSQPTGFAGRGNLGGPLVPQVTGYVDPRLQMMQSQFMPANISAPYNAGGIPQLQIQPQQQGGISLQQSFQQHNQAQRGTAAPKVPWALSKAEKKNYDQIFRAWDAQGTGFISGQTALEVFGQSGLDKNDLARIWTLADGDNRGKLNMAEFHVAMGLIYRRLNGNDIPDELPAELVPPSSRDLDTSVNFLKDILKNDTSRSPANLDGPVSRLPERSFNSNNSPRAGGRQDGTVYKHSDDEPAGGYYKPRSRHVDRDTVRSQSQTDSPSADLSDMKRQLENAAKMLDRATEADASRTAEDEALEREMSDVRYRVKRVQEDLEYVARGPRSSAKDEERRKLERELMKLMHERLPELERRIEECEKRKEREKREWTRDRDRRNDTHGRFDDRDAGRYSPARRYDDDERNRPYSRGAYDRDDRDGSYRRDRSRDERPRTPPAPRSPPPPPPTIAPSSNNLPPPAPPAPVRSPAPTKNMTPEERKAWISAEAKRRMAERMQALGVHSSPSAPTLDTSVEDRLAQERKEAEEKSRADELQAEQREMLRKERLQKEKALKDGNAPATPVAPIPVASTLAGRKPAPPPPKPRAAAPPPPQKPISRPTISVQVPAPPAAPPVVRPPAAAPPPEIDPEEEAFRAREEALRMRREERAAQLKRLEEEELEAQRAEEAVTARRQALARAKSATPSPVPPTPVVALPAAVAPPPPPPPPPVADASNKNPPVGDKSSTNPFSKLMGNGSATGTPSAASASGGANNPFFRSQTAPPPVAPAPPKSPVPAPVKATYHTAPASDDEDGWDDVREKDNDDDSSDDEIVSSKTKRDEIARQLFGNILPPARPQSAAAGPTARSSLPGSPAPPPAAPPAPAAPPPPPAAPMASPPSSVSIAAPAPTGDRGALLGAIQGGLKLKKTVTKDRSGAPVSGRVVGDTAPPPHINAAPRPVSPPSPPSAPATRENHRQSVDWYAGMAADHGAAAQASLPATIEEDETTAEHQALAPVPQIQVSDHAAEAPAEDPMDDIDKSTEHRVRSLYLYEGQRPEDLSFGENLILLANPSKTGNDWWYGTVLQDGKSGFFPKTYVEEVEIVKATAIYSYTGDNADELSFEEGDMLSIVDRSDGDWWKAERDGVVSIVPAAYLQVLQAGASSSRTQSIGVASTRPALTHDHTQGRPQTPVKEIEGTTESSDDAYFSADDSEDDDDEQTESNREAREKERQRVLEAAGLIVTLEVKPPLRLERVRSGRQRRPPPVAPYRSLDVSNSSTPVKDLPSVPERDNSPIDSVRLDDAFDRYEAFKQTQGNTNNRLSVASSFETALSTPAESSPAASLAPSISGENRPYSNLLHFLSRKTPANEAPEKKMLTISSPIMNLPEGLLRENSPAFGSSWASLVDKTVLQEIPKGERRRQEAIFELIATEGDYVRDLQLIVEVFYSSMLPMLDQKAITVIFANVEDILLTNTTLLSSLEERQKECRLYVDRIGDILKTNMSNMALYMNYCVNQGAAIKVLRSLRDENSDLESHLQRLRDDPAVRNLDLSSYLLVPMQRVTKYPLLIRQILQYTDAATQDRDEMEQALDIAESVLSHINETIRDQEGRERLKVISQDLWVGQGRLDLTAPTRQMGHRKLLREGILFKAKSGRKLRAFLCSDIIVLTDDTAKTLYRMPIPLAEVQVKEVSGGREDTTFQISLAYPRGGDAVALRATSVRDCQLWMQAIDEACQRCRDAERMVRVSGKSRGGRTR